MQICKKKMNKVIEGAIDGTVLGTTEEAMINFLNNNFVLIANGSQTSMHLTVMKCLYLIAMITSLVLIMFRIRLGRCFIAAGMVTLTRAVDHGRCCSRITLIP